MMGGFESRRVRNALLGAIWGLNALMVIAGLIEAPDPAIRLQGIQALVIVLFGFSSLGVLIVARADNLIGWIFCAAGSLMAYQYWVWTRQNDVGPWEALLVGSVVYIAAAIAVPTLILVFPDGRLPSRRWWPVRWFGIGAVTAGILSTLFTPTIWGTSDPAPLAGIMPDAVRSVLDVVAFVLLVPFIVGVVASPIVRYRRAVGVERSQFKMFGYGAALAFLGWFVPAFIDVPVSDVVTALGLMALPLSITAAILRYRLYDIERLISRTVGYAIVAVAIALVYVTGAVWLPTLVTGEQSPVFVAGSTLAVAALVNPLRRRVLRWADRRFFRSHYDTDHILTEFGDRLRAGVGINRLTEDSLAVISQTVHPASIGLWIRE